MASSSGSVNVTLPLSIRVDPETARAYEAAAPSERTKFGLILGLRLAQLVRPDGRDTERLLRLMDEIGQEAQARGLTPEILERLLNDPDDG